MSDLLLSLAFKYLVSREMQSLIHVSVDAQSLFSSENYYFKALQFIKRAFSEKFKRILCSCNRKIK